MKLNERAMEFQKKRASFLSLEARSREHNSGWIFEDKFKYWVELRDLPLLLLTKNPSV
jgi:hypothetical protein